MVFVEANGLFPLSSSRLSLPIWDIRIIKLYRRIVYGIIYKLLTVTCFKLALLEKKSSSNQILIFQRPNSLTLEKLFDIKMEKFYIDIYGVIESSFIVDFKSGEKSAKYALKKFPVYETATRFFCSSATASRHVRVKHYRKRYQRLPPPIH